MADLNNLKHLREWSLPPLIGAFLATIGIMMAVTARWGKIVNRISGKSPIAWLDYFYYFVTSRLVGFVLPKDVIDLGGRMAWLNLNHDIPLKISGKTVFLDRLFDLFMATIFLIASLPYWLGWINNSTGILIMVGFALLGFVFLCLGYANVLRILYVVYEKISLLLTQLPWFKEKSISDENTLHFNRKILLQLYVFSLVKFILTTARLILFSNVWDLPISPALIILGTSIGQFSYLFAFTPGGLGIFEAGWFAILQLGGVGVEFATVFVIGQRILTVIYVVILVVIGQVLYSYRHHFKANEGFFVDV